MVLALAGLSTTTTFMRCGGASGLGMRSRTTPRGALARVKGGDARRRLSNCVTKLLHLKGEFVSVDTLIESVSFWMAPMPFPAGLPPTSMSDYIEDMLNELAELADRLGGRCSRRGDSAGRTGGHARQRQSARPDRPLRPARTVDLQAPMGIVRASRFPGSAPVRARLEFSSWPNRLPSRFA